MEPIRAIFNWSGGKDSALCLFKLLQKKGRKYQIEGLVTTVSTPDDRIGMHGVRNQLLVQQCHGLSIPLYQLSLPEMPSMEVYEQGMTKTLLKFKEKGIQHAIFGDIFLEDLKQYRDQQLAKIGFKGVYPLWKMPTHQLINDFIDLGFKAVVVCVNDHFLDKAFAGRIIDRHFVDDLPKGVDPCGENGEFHTFVFDGPIFKTPVQFRLGELVYRNYRSEGNATDQSINPGFWFIDLVPH